MKYSVRIIDAKTRKEKIIALEGLEGIANPEQIVMMEFKLNEIPNLRFHIIEREF